MARERADDDKIDIGLTKDSQKFFAEVESRGWFQEGQDLARFCMAYAIKAGVKEPRSFTPGAETRWASGNFDKTNEIRGVIRALFPGCTTPVRLIEHFVNEGLRMVHERISRSGDIGPAELLD